MIDWHPMSEKPKQGGLVLAVQWTRTVSRWMPEIAYYDGTAWHCSKGCEWWQEIEYPNERHNV